MVSRKSWPTLWLLPGADLCSHLVFLGKGVQKLFEAPGRRRGPRCLGRRFLAYASACGGRVCGYPAELIAGSRAWCPRRWPVGSLRLIVIPIKGQLLRFRLGDKRPDCYATAARAFPAACGLFHRGAIEDPHKNRAQEIGNYQTERRGTLMLERRTLHLMTRAMDQ